MQITDLKPSISRLSYQESYALIRELRALRRELKPVRPKKTPAKKKTPKQKRQKQLSIEEMLAMMSPKQAKELLEKLNKKG
jgi:hypothetical protein